MLPSGWARLRRKSLERLAQLEMLAQVDELIDRAHHELVRRWSTLLKELGFWLVVTHSHKAKNTTHQCGTLCFGTDPRESVLDPFRAAGTGVLLEIDVNGWAQVKTKS